MEFSRGIFYWGLGSLVEEFFIYYYITCNFLGGINGSGDGEGSFSSGLGRDWDGQSYFFIIIRCRF
jgi:hypothetical protein